LTPSLGWAAAAGSNAMPALAPPRITGPIPVTKDSMPFGTTMAEGS
jgi:hypothetical protein